MLDRTLLERDIHNRQLGDIVELGQPFPLLTSISSASSDLSL